MSSSPASRDRSGPGPTNAYRMPCVAELQAASGRRRGPRADDRDHRHCVAFGPSRPSGLVAPCNSWAAELLTGPQRARASGEPRRTACRTRRESATHGRIPDGPVDGKTRTKVRSEDLVRVKHKAPSMCRCWRRLDRRGAPGPGLIGGVFRRLGSIGGVFSGARERPAGLRARPAGAPRPGRPPAARTRA